MRRILRCATVMSSVVLLGGCGSGSSEDDEFASVVCTELRGFNDELVDIVNDSVSGISAMSADHRSRMIAGGLESVRGAVEGWNTRIDQIELPEIAEAEQVRVQLHTGAAQALEELDDQREELALGPIDDREVQGAVGAWFNSIEKVMSVSEPEIFRFESREFKQAFLDEPACRNVVQQFVND